jgi:hypothetical protein
MNWKLSALAVAACLTLTAKLPKPAMPVVTTERVEFAPGGTIRVTGSTGELNVEGWDKPEVEITVTRSTYRTDTPKERDEAKRQLEAIKVTAERKGPAELVINTAVPSRSFWAKIAFQHPDAQVDYRIRVPRDSKLVVKHGSGDVVVYDVAGEIEASVRTGDIILQLPAAGKYAVDAECRFGGVESEFGGDSHIAHLESEHLVDGQGKKLFLRVGTGTIKIQKIASGK